MIYDYVNDDITITTSYGRLWQFLLLTVTDVKTECTNSCCSWTY